jgi:histidinol-phosphatase (PHP family)
VSFQDDFLHAHPLDIVLGSVHYQSFWATDKAEQTLFDKEELIPVYRRYYKLVSLMAECGLYDVVAHFDLPKKNGRKLPDEDQRKFVLPTLDRIARAGMAIEINTSGLRDKVGEIYPSPQILSWAHERDIPITFGSNAHSPGQVGADFDQAVALAREVGYTHYNSYTERIANPVPLNGTNGLSAAATST